MSKTHSISKTLGQTLLGFSLGFSVQSYAGISYSLVENQAAAGETVTVRAILFNDGSNELTWSPPNDLVMQWRNVNGGALRSLAQLDGSGQSVSVPVNNFVIFNWKATVPTALDGVQAVSIEGAPDLFALDVSSDSHSLLASSIVTAPIVDAGAAGPNENEDPVLSDDKVLALGATPSYGPAVGQAPSVTPAPTAFENFRNAISSHDAVYFIVGNRPEKNARFQISFKYRLATPADDANTRFWNHLYMGYTQTAIWDLSSDSSPFIDTTYNPSVFWRKDALFRSDDYRKFFGLDIGVEHASNGKGDNDSRSLNDVYIQPEFNYRLVGGSTLKFAPRYKQYFSTSDNPDYRDYAGNVDWRLSWAQDNGLQLGALYRRGKEGRDSKQFDVSWPLRRTPLNMNGYLYVQYFRGYGETLLGYNHKSDPHIRFGLAFVP
ncbi:phospholipase A [Paenalcaligenes niemegkensis]|uniref:phospholipase A n=1 Tax=Paenalcaligenes niemegkensis TaxID=2895469 RepID=UPI001EE7A2EA|nr:phospholipase A [Paenalcaligenes niemegkensis]MCQ9615796.1 phospholipase A [Paenalcaligenes niemegkensis]